MCLLISCHWKLVQYALNFLYPKDFGKFRPYLGVKQLARKCFSG